MGVTFWPSCHRRVDSKVFKLGTCNLDCTVFRVSWSEERLKRVEEKLRHLS